MTADFLGIGAACLAARAAVSTVATYVEEERSRSRKYEMIGQAAQSIGGIITIIGVWQAIAVLMASAKFTARARTGCLLAFIGIDTYRLGQGIITNAFSYGRRATPLAARITVGCPLWLRSRYR